MQRKINPNLQKLAERTYNPNLKPINLEEQTERRVQSQNLDGSIYVPSLNLYFAKKRSLLGRNWHDTHKELLANQGNVRMPTPNETWELIFYLKEHLANPEFREVYDDILKLTPKDTWHGEWQNAIFSVQNGIMYVQKATGINPKGELIFSTKERLEDCLKQNSLADILRNDLTKQGLCKTPSTLNSYSQGKNIYFYYPREGYVARFVADSDGAYLVCIWHPGSSDPSLGVRVVREAHALK